METDDGHLQNPTVDTILKGYIRQSLLHNKILSTRWLQWQRSISLFWKLRCRVQVLIESVLLWGLFPSLLSSDLLPQPPPGFSGSSNTSDFSSINVCHAGFWSNLTNQFYLNLLSKGFLSKSSHPETLRIRILAWESRLQGTQPMSQCLKTTPTPKKGTCVNVSCRHFTQCHRQDSGPLSRRQGTKDNWMGRGDKKLFVSMGYMMNCE